MANTGNLVTVYQDINPLSLTYLTTKEEKTSDLNTCPLDQANYVKVDTYCEVDDATTFLTGYKLDVYEDQNPASSTYGNLKTERFLDNITCPPTSAEPNYRPVGDPYCELQTINNQQVNTGNQIQLMQDQNPHSATYEEVDEAVSENLVDCPKPNIDPVWISESSACHIVLSGDTIIFDGTEDVIQRDMNTLSSTYLVTRTINQENAERCPRGDTSPIWEDVSATCIQSSGQNTGWENVVQVDTNPNSPTYEQNQTIMRLNVIACPTGSTEHIRMEPQNTNLPSPCGGSFNAVITSSTYNWVIQKPQEWMSISGIVLAPELGEYMYRGYGYTVNVTVTYTANNGSKERGGSFLLWNLDAYDNTSNLFITNYGNQAVCP